MSWLQFLTSNFEALKMLEDKSIVELNFPVLDIANESFTLREKISNTKLVRKVLLSLSQRFNMKVRTIKEANDIASMKLDELFGSLRTFKLNMGDGEPKERNGVALQFVSENVPHQHKQRVHDDQLADSIALLTK